jgi:Ca-activated chloride channel family protein
MRFISPGVLVLLLAVPALVAGYLMLNRRRRRYTVRFTNLELLAAIAPRRPGWRRHVAPALLLLTLVLLVAALARPTAPVRVPREQASVILVMDVSRSMSATDLQPDRISAAKVAASDFVRSLPQGLNVGLVSFSNFPALISPLTQDREQTLTAIEQLQPLAGTAMGEGLALALSEIQRQRDTGRRVPASVLVLSDGQSNIGRPPEMAAEQAKEMDVRVFTVGIGTPNATLEFQGQIVRVDLNEEQLMGVAEATGGSYFESGSAESLRRVYQGLGSSLGYARARRELTWIPAAFAAALLLAAGAAGLLWYQRIP